MVTSDSTYGYIRRGCVVSGSMAPVSMLMSARTGLTGWTPPLSIVYRKLVSAAAPVPSGPTLSARTEADFDAKCRHMTRSPNKVERIRW